MEDQRKILISIFSGLIGFGVVIGLSMNLSPAIDFHKKYYTNFKLYLKLKV